MSAADLRECQIELGGSVRCPVEPLVVPYLAACIRRCDDELRTDARGVVTANARSGVHDTLQECRSAAVRMIGLVLSL